MRNRVHNKYGKNASTFLVALLCLFATLPLSAQQRAVHGTVIDNTGEPIVGAMVTVTGTDRVTITDVTGAFTLQASPTETLTVTYLGYAAAVYSAENTNPVINMEPDAATQIEDVVVTGYFTQKKVTLTGSIVSVDNSEIMLTKSENVVNMLAGKAPGLRVFQASAQPGKVDDVKFDVRGFGNPVIVVDGIVRDKGYFARMDPSEIGNVSILKDGTAAVYGSDANGGAILITTKRGVGSSNKYNISLSANVGWQHTLYVPETASPLEHMMLINEKRYNNFGANYPRRAAPFYNRSQIEPWLNGEPGTNWNKEIFKENAPTQQYNLNLDGGSDKVSYFFNIGYMKQMGVYRSGDLNYNRWNFRNNTDIKITNRLRAAVNLSGYMDTRNQPAGDNSLWSVYKHAWTFRPLAPAWVDGDHNRPVYDPDSWLGGEVNNPVAYTNGRFVGYDQRRNYDMSGSLNLTYDIPGVKGLNVQALYNYQLGMDNNTSLVRSYNLYGLQGQLYARNLSPSLRRDITPNHSENIRGSLNYLNTFAEDHGVSGTLVYEERYGEDNGIYAQRNMILDGEYLNFGEVEGQQGGQDGLGEWSQKALIGRVGYDYKGRYMADFAFRYETRSTFPTLGTWGFFPSTSAGWRISEENFLKDNVSFIDNLKLRFSYGQMGGDAPGSRAVNGYQLDPDVGWVYGSYMTGSHVLATPNPNLSWTVSHALNVGLDFELWDGKLGGMAEVFRRARTGIRRRPDTQVPREVGAALPDENMDSDMIFGWEFMLSHRNRVGEFNYNVMANISATKSRWISRADSDAGNSMEQYRRWTSSGRNKSIWTSDREEGGRFSSYDEIWNHYLPSGQATPGDYWYEDWNGDGQINDQDEHPVATFELPTFNYGISAEASWRGLDFYMLWQGAAGFYAQYGEVFTEVGPFESAAVLDYYIDRWHTVHPSDDPWNPNTQWVEGTYPATGHSFSTGTTGILNQSYIRLKTIEMGYTLPKRWLTKTGIENLRVYVNAYNLLTITGVDNIDPERPSSRGALGSSGSSDAAVYYGYPNVRDFRVGATLKF